MQTCSSFPVPNNLSGTLPPELGYLDLTAIALEKQRGLYGPLPSTIGKSPYLRSLSILFMAPRLGGILPSSLFVNPSMVWLTLVENEGTWEFPTTIPSTPGTNHSLLGLTMTGMSGTIPSYIGEFHGLTRVDFPGGSLSGTLPDSIGNLTSLGFLNLHGNKLNGTLPASLGRLVGLTAAVFGKNDFQGSLPSWFGSMTSLRLLDLSYNQFEGTVPATFSRLASLERVSLQHNANLHGSIAPFEPLQRLSSLILYGNHFSSTIPAGLFSNFTGEIFADFGHNNFSVGLTSIN